MKYLWIGVGQSVDGKAILLQNGGKVLSAETANDALINGLEKNGIFCDSINGPKIDAYPVYKKKYIGGYSWSRTNKSVDYNVGYLNIKYINRYFKRISMEKAAEKWANQNINEEVTIFVYQMHRPFMSAAAEIKKIIPTAKIILLVPDLPQFMDMNMSAVKTVLKKLDWYKIKKLMQSVDRYVLYSKYMADFLKLKAGSWTVMEGCFDSTEIVDGYRKEPTNTVSVMYSGYLELHYGIPELLKAFEMLPDNYELWFTGNGNAVELIKEYSMKNNRIKYLGYLPSKKDLLIKQQESTMLISIRNPEEEASKYCFPSKLFEYMSSGNPVISTDILGIPDEYKEYLVIINSFSSESIYESIVSVGNMTTDERKKFGQKAKMFVINEKNNCKQAQKLLL